MGGPYREVFLTLLRVDEVLATINLVRNDDLLLLDLIHQFLVLGVALKCLGEVILGNFDEYLHFSEDLRKYLLVVIVAVHHDLGIELIVLVLESDTALLDKFPPLRIEYDPVPHNARQVNGLEVLKVDDAIIVVVH